jgi:hypothetical protein
VGGSEEPARAPEAETKSSTHSNKRVRAWMSRAIGRLTNWWSGRSKNAQRILAGYVVVLVFFAVFFILAALGSNRLSRILGDTSMLLLLSLIAVFPSVVEFLRPIVSNVKVGILEVSFREIVDQTEALIAELQPIDLEKENLQFMATDRWENIMRELDRFNELNAEVIRVDLGTASKRTWKFPNLYFFTLLLELRSGVRNLLFVHQRDDGRHEFITMCDPRSLREDLERLSPQFGVAAAKWKRTQDRSVLEQPKNISFEEALQEADNELSGSVRSSDARGRQPSYLDGWVEPQGLLRVLGPHVNLCRIPWKQRLTRDDYLAILSCSDPYVAVIKDGSLESVLDRDRVALAVARQVT